MIFVCDIRIAVKCFTKHREEAFDAKNVIVRIVFLIAFVKINIYNFFLTEWLSINRLCPAD